MVCLVYKCSWNIGDAYEKNGSYKSCKREIKNGRGSKKQNIRAFTITEQLTKKIYIK